MLGVILLLLFVFASVSYAVVSNEQLESTMYRNQYRLGSKALTTAVQSYAVSGNKFYYDAYMQELKTDKNRTLLGQGLRRMISKITSGMNCAKSQRSQTIWCRLKRKLWRQLPQEMWHRQPSLSLGGVQQYYPENQFLDRRSDRQDSEPA